MIPPPPPADWTPPAARRPGWCDPAARRVIDPHGLLDPEEADRLVGLAGFACDQVYAEMDRAGAHGRRHLGAEMLLRLVEARGPYVVLDGWTLGRLLTEVLVAVVPFRWGPAA